MPVTRRLPTVPPSVPAKLPRAYRGPRPTAVVLAAFALAAVLGGCGPSRLARVPAAPTDLSGSWQLDRGASDDAERAIAAALPSPRKARREAQADARAAARPDLPVDARAEARADARAEAFRTRGGGNALGFLRDFVAPAEYLEVLPDGEAVLTIVQGERRRTHELGTEFPPSVTDRYGSRVVRAGWEGRTLVVTSDGGRQFALRETFRPGPEPDTLSYRVELRAQGLKDIDVDALYRRATTARPAARVPSDGPPAPSR